MNNSIWDRPALLDEWLAEVLRGYPWQTARQMTDGGDPFRNPSGHLLRQNLAVLLDAVLIAQGHPDAGRALEYLMRLRAVQDFTPAVREAIGAASQLPVLGALRRSDGPDLLPTRHMGLVPPTEHAAASGLAFRLRTMLAPSLDVDRLLAIAHDVRSLGHGSGSQGRGPRHEAVESPGVGLRATVKIGVVRDAAFTFYYPDNLEALEAAGASLVFLSSLTAREIPPDLGALYIGGGFPETHVGAIAANTSFLCSIKNAADRGLPIYAECGGLVLLSRALRVGDRVHSLAGVLPFDVGMQPTPQGHGYIQMTVDRPTVFFSHGTELRGHAFHYSRVLAAEEDVQTSCAVTRGNGCIAGRDGVVFKNTFATYCHLHALASPEWAPGVVAAARQGLAGKA